MDEKLRWEEVLEKAREYYAEQSPVADTRIPEFMANFYCSIDGEPEDLLGDEELAQETSTDELIELLKSATVEWASIGRLLALRNGSASNIARAVEEIKQTFREYGESAWVDRIRW